MDPRLLLQTVLFSLLVSLHLPNITGDTSSGYHAEERDALYALKRILNHPFLNSNWTGLQCYFNHPPRWYGIQCLDGRVTGVSLDKMELSGNIGFDAFIFLPELTELNFSHNSLTGNIMNFAANTKLKRLDFSRNQFTGPVPQSILGLDTLESLLLQDNNLTGQVPAFDQTSLVSFNVSNNNLSGRVPLTKALQLFGPDSFSGNPNLCGPPLLVSCNPRYSSEQTGDQSPQSTAKKSYSPAMFGLTVIILIVGIVSLSAAILLFVLYKKKVRELKKIQGGMVIKESEQIEVREKRRSSVSSLLAEYNEGQMVMMDSTSGAFELGDLLKASAEELGSGIFGKTYKAHVEDGRAVVVKKVKDLKPMTVEEFRRRLHFLADQRHPNLLPPLAYFFSKEEKLLLYRFADHGNIFNRIHGGRDTKERMPFRWNSRLSVARGVARALEHLHRSTKPASGVIPHGNLKCTNILLDNNDVALVSDYGLASLVALPIASQSMTAYKSPEYQTTKKISHKADIWSYGCFLMELLTGRVCLASAPPGMAGVDLCSWVHRAVREEWTAEIFDMELAVQKKAAPGIVRLLRLAIQCCDKIPDRRPEIWEIVREVDSLKETSTEDEDDLSSDRSLTDESLSTSASGTVVGL